MRATPEIIEYGDDKGSMKPPVSIAGDGGMIILCRTYGTGRSDPVEVFVPADMVDQLLLACRDQARENRRRSGPTSDIRSPLLEPDRGRRPDPPPTAEAETIASEFVRNVANSFPHQTGRRRFSFEPDPNAPAVADILYPDD